MESPGMNMGMNNFNPPHGMGGMGPMNSMGMGMGMGMNMRGPPPRHTFRPFGYPPRPPPQGPMSQDDFDGKRLRKSVMRKTVDYNAAIIRALEGRVWQRDWRDRLALQPDAMYTPELLPPPSYPDNPINAVTTRFVKTATNKMRCPIFSVAWTPEGRRLVTGASSGEFTLWNGLTFNFETILQAHESPVRSMVWSRGEGWMVTGDHSGYVKYWQSNMNNVKMFQAHKEAVRGITFSPSDAKIATCSDDGTIRIFDFYRCQEERILRGHGSDVKCVQWHPTKALIVSGSKDNQQPIKLWDPKSGQSLATLHAHKSTVMDLKWNDNGNWLITASRDHLLKLFDIRKMGTEIQIFRGHKKEASSVAWHPTHEGLFCSGGSDGAIMFWNVGTDKEVGSIEDAHESIVWTLAWHPLGHILCSGSNDHTSKFWTRNRPGDLMRDKYNLNTLPRGIQDEQDLDDPSMIPGMGPEDKVEIFNSTDKAIPGLDLDTSVIPLDSDKKGKKVPYSKPIPRNFQAHWNHAPGDDSSEALAQALVEAVPGVVPLQEIAPSAIIMYGKIVPVEPGSKLGAAIAEGPKALKKFIASGEIEELHDVMPHIEDDEEEDSSSTQFLYPNADESEVKDTPSPQEEIEEENDESYEPSNTNQQQQDYYQFQSESNYDTNMMNYNSQSVNYETERTNVADHTSSYMHNQNRGHNDNVHRNNRMYNEPPRSNFNSSEQSHNNSRQYNESSRDRHDYDNYDVDQRSEGHQRYRNDNNGRGHGNWGYPQRSPDVEMQDRNMMNGSRNESRSGMDRMRSGGGGGADRGDRGRGGSPGVWRGSWSRGRQTNQRGYRRPSRNPY